MFSRVSCTHFPAECWKSTSKSVALADLWEGSTDVFWWVKMKNIYEMNEAAVKQNCEYLERKEMKVSKDLFILRP